MRQLGRRIALVFLALTMSTALVTLVGTGPAAAKVVVQPGSVDCSNITGTLSFKPPLTATGTALDAISLVASISGCQASGGGISPVAGAATSKESLPSNNCFALVTSFPTVTLKVKWSPKTIASTSVSFSFLNPTTGPTIGLVAGGPGTTETGSYEGADAGGSATATLETNETLADAEAACGGRGIKSVKIASGTAHFG